MTDSTTKPDSATPPQAGANPSEARDRSQQTTGAAGPPAAPAPAAAPDPAKSARRPPRASIETLEQLIDLAYTRKGQRVSLPRKSLVRIAQSPQMSESAETKLLDRARADIALTVTRQLLVVAESLDQFGRLQQELLRFIGAALRQHPVLASDRSLVAGQCAIDAPEPSEAIAMVARHDLSTFDRVSQAGLKSKAQLKELRINLLHSLALWFFLRRRTPLHQLIGLLLAQLWSREAEAIKAEGVRLRRILEVRDSAALGIACLQFAQDAREQARVAEAARRTERAAVEKADELSAKVDTLQTELRKAKAEIVNLRAAEAEQTRLHEDELLHLRDAFEHLRTRALRTLKTEIALLEEGLHAARLTPPKVHVTIDHAERAIGALREEAKRLEVVS